MLDEELEKAWYQGVGEQPEKEAVAEEPEEEEAVAEEPEEEEDGTHQRKKKKSGGKRHAEKIRALRASNKPEDQEELQRLAWMRQGTVLPRFQVPPYTADPTCTVLFY